MSSRPSQTSKGALGRGLDELLPKPQQSEQRDGLAEASPPALNVNVHVGPGLSTLLRGTRTSTEAKLAVELREQNAVRRAFCRPALVASLVSADLLLLGQTAMLVLGSSGSPSLGEWLFAGLSVGLGAWLSCLAILLVNQQDR